MQLSVWHAEERNEIGQFAFRGNFFDMDRQFDFGTFGLITYRLLASLKRSV